MTQATDITELRAELEHAGTVGINVPPETLKTLLDRLEQSEAFTVVQPCKLTQEEPFDFGQCETHDRTFPLGGTCDYQGQSLVNYLDDQEAKSRGRAVKAELRANDAEQRIQRTLQLHSVAYDSAHDETWEINKRCAECQQAWPCLTVRTLNGEAE